MKKIFTIALLLVGLGLCAQNYNNEWIDYSKTYYKFKVGATGLYRIPQSVLATAGLGGQPAQNFQLFRNGQEVPVYTSVASGPLGSSDYIEFWGRINDGVPDQPLYRSPSYQHTQKWSLETDTAVYFLTVNTSGNAFHFVNTNNDTTGTPLTAEPYFMYKAAGYFRQGGVNPGFAQVVGQYIYSSSYDIGEFWSTPQFYPGGPFTDNQSNLFVYGAGPDASIRFGMTGCADNVRTVQVSVNNTVLADTVMNSFFDLLTSRTVPLSLIGGGSASVQFSNNSTVPTDRIVASFYELDYPRQFNFGGQPNFYFELPARSAGYFLKINNFGISGSIPPVLYDVTNGLRYTAIVGPGSTLSFLLGGSASTRKLVLVNEDPSTVQTVTGLTSKTFVNFSNSANQGNYIIISHRALYTGSSGNNPIFDYKAYRSSAPGGSFNAQVYDIDELVDQFAFGIKKHPLSIHNFLRYARAVFAAKPQYVLLIGHGMVYADYTYYAERIHDPLADGLNLVPTFGNPASDNKFSAGNAIDAVPIIPIGRISAVSGAEVENYLNKVKEYEQVQVTASNTIADRLWMKNVVHLTGVSEPYLGTILCNYMNSYRQIIADTLMGGNVTTFCDGNASQVSQVPGGVMASLLSTGVSMLTYFGHSSSTTLGYNLDNPADYNNTGKYPVFFINGCDAGDFFVYDNLRLASSKSLSESWVLAKDKGSIAFVASTHFGIVNYLNILLYGLYNLIDQADYGKTLGVIQKDALQSLVNASPGDFFARLHAEQMTLHGDPYIKLNQESLADYDVEASQVVINPSFISVADNNFTVKAKFYNLGRAVQDSITVLIKRQYPDGSSTILLKKRIPGIRYSDSIEIAVPIVASRDKGQNIVTVTINSDNNVPEVTMANNTVATNVYIYQNEATPIYPYNYAIINANKSKLYASTANPFDPSQQFIMEIDTTAFFNSPSLVTKNLTSVGGELEFDPGITYRDSIVYYWRVAIVPQAGSQYIWNTSSFVYIDSVASGVGSNQSHFFQHTQSTPHNIHLDSASRRWIFDSAFNNLYIQIGTWVSSTGTEQQVSITVNDGQYFMHNALSFSSLVFTVFDPITFRPWLNTTTGGVGMYGSFENNAYAGREYEFEYPYRDSASRRKMMNFMDNVIPNGAYVVVRSFMLDPAIFGIPGIYAADWHADTVVYGAGNSIYNRLLSQGFSGIDSFSRPRNFYFMYKKNQPNIFMPQWLFTQGVTDNVTSRIVIKTPDTSGTVTSPTFGPAKKWNQLHWRGSSLESPSADTAYVQLIGIDTAGKQTPLFNVGINNQDYDISSINAKQYPFLQLKMSTSDTVTGTPYQLKYWRLSYQPSPEGALAPNIYLLVKDTLQIGEPLNFGIAFKNVSPYAFDSVRLKLNIIDKNNVTHTIVLPRKKPLISGDTLTVSYRLDTKNYPGANTIYLDINPDNDQPEQYHFNNFLYKSFYVKSDNRNPLMDVTFDNVHILNNDIVSAKPHIQIKLKSQSQYLLLTDTSLITVQVKFPDGSLHNYGFNSDTLRFTPATAANNNEATVEFTPAFTKQYNADGDNYELIVSGKDQLGNTAGTTPYRIGFKIITKAMISNLLNYPNPFTTSTAFVFTITGSDVPQNIKIQILTITGKIVREITKDELGPLHVGRNITEFKWNGTDMYGQRLANGVYLYHVVTNLNGKSLDKYKASGDNTDQYFNNGYGKMYLMK
ncbi:MAG TPA: C25 family cysteine peptidase [Puia sp.]